MEILEQLRSIAWQNKKSARKAAPQTSDDAGMSHRACLDELARRCGFSGWNHLSHIVSGDSPADFGDLLCPRRCAAHWNIWFANYDEASRVRAEHGGFLLAYRTQFLVVDEDYLRTLGLDPAAPDWALMGRDWVRPADRDARSRLYSELIRKQLELL